MPSRLSFVDNQVWIIFDHAPELWSILISFYVIGVEAGHKYFIFLNAQNLVTRQNEFLEQI